jgi:glycosyltransferase involved in cell wall biosynthesis
MNPEISVLMTVYNEQRFLAETIKSILNQTFKDFELIIVNDGSTDNTKKIIQEYMKKDKRIIYLENKINKGFNNWHNILNLGLAKAKAKYIARIDADDLCHPNRLKKQYDYLERNKNLFLIGTSADVIDYRGKKIDEMIKKHWPSKIIKYRLSVSNPFIHSSIFFRNEGFKYPSQNEHAFYLNLSRNGKKLRNIREKLIAYRINPEGLMAQHANLETNKYKKLYKQKLN